MRFVASAVPLLLSLLLSFSFAPAAAGENSDCLACHGERDFLTERDGKPFSLFVDAGRFGKSVHSGLGCVSCHADLEGVELPHPERLKKVVCGICHEDPMRQFADSLHGAALKRGDTLAPDCQRCHGSHGILPVKDHESSVTPLKVPYLCGSCHSEGAPVSKQRDIPQHNILKNYSLSIHGEGLLSKGLTVSATCSSCHTPHHILPHTDERSTIARKNIVATCTRCHGQIENVHRKIINGKLWQEKPEVIPVCVECHQPHKARKVFYDKGMADADCLRCHGRKGIRRSGDGAELFVDKGHLNGSAHRDVACAQCHKGIAPSKHRPCEKVEAPVDCGVCHSGQVEQYLGSTHGQLALKNDPNAPRCTECHGDHGIKKKMDPKSATFPINVPALCSRCHREGRKAAARYKGKQHDIAKSYVESIHGKGLLKSGLVVTATCTNCHSAHGELPADDPKSTVNPRNIAETCSRCHHGVYEQFSSSVHSALANPTGKALPACIDCHTAHTIQRADKDNFKLDIMDRCGRCHEDVAKTYFETYHGKVSQLGYAKTAKCHDCHGAHGIHSVDDPRSMLSRQNIVETCRKCHPGSNKRFAGYLTHSTHHDPDKYPLVFWTFWIMTSLLVGTFGFFGLHTLLWLPRSFQMRLAHPHLPPKPGEKQFRRFTDLNRIQHVVMILTFITLALTGMMLKFSYTGWAVLLSRVLGGFESAGFLHRTAAIVMFGLFVTHLWDLARRKRHECGGWLGLLMGPSSMVPTLRDLGEFIATIKWYVGAGPRPQYGRWTYWEKFDYFAVFWGITIIGSTGLMLWFPEIITKVLPGWLINVAGIIHGDEALLAVGFIFTIHFFNTHFRPEKFPMDLVVFTGRMSLEEFKLERPDEYEALKKSGRLEEHLADPPSPAAIRAARIFGWAALAVGIALVIGIIYAMIFAYR